MKYLTLFLLSSLFLLTGCQTGFDRAMDYKDDALDARKETAILALGGQIIEETETRMDEMGNPIETTTITTSLETPDGAETSSGPTGITLEPGARVDFGYYVRNTGAVPIEVDPSVMLGQGNAPREVSPTEKLALLESFWGETGNFVPKSAYEQTLEIAARVGLGYFIYDAGKTVIESNNSIAREALNTPPTIIEVPTPIEP